MNSHIEIGAPAILPLAFANMAGRPVLLGMTLQHPPIHLRVGKSKQLDIHGPRAHVARAYAKKYLQSSGLEMAAEIIIENTSPALVGFGSDEMLALSVAQALAWANDKDIDDISAHAHHVGLGPDAALAYWAFAKGGVLLVEMQSAAGQMPSLLRRAELEHRQNKAWSINFYFPDAPAGAPDDHEQQQRANLNAAAATISPKSGQILDEELWPALENDDIYSFAAALQKLIEMNNKVLQEQGSIPNSNELLEPTLKFLADESPVLVSGAGLTGHCVYALALSALHSQEIRMKLRKKVGPFGGQIEATINDIIGRQQSSKDEHLHFHDYKLPNLVDGVTGEGRK